MDTTRFVLVVSLSLVILLLWDAWQRDYGLQQKAFRSQEHPVEITEQPVADMPAIPENQLKETILEPQITRKDRGVRLRVITDVLGIDIDTHGGGINRADLLKYPISLEQTDIPVQLLSDEPSKFYILQGGLLSNSTAPTHDAIYTSPQTEYTLMTDQEVLQVPLFWEGPDGIKVNKIYEFHRGQYLVNIRYEVTNTSQYSWTGGAYGQLQRTDPGERKMRTVYTYTGAVISSPEKRYEKIEFEDIKEKPLSKNITDGWAAMIKHYFISALIPGTQTDEYHYYTLFVDNKPPAQDADRYIIGMTTPQVTILPKKNATLEHKLYLGPKLQNDLQEIAPGLELTVDYGVFWFIAKPLFWCLQKFHSLTGNWGWSIVLVTLMLKILFYNLSAAGYRSMANMRKVQPRLLAIRDRYKNDRARLNQAMMEIYKQEKINPLGGCFPILVQIPVFIALYWVLLESVELRQTGFVLWIRDLSGADPYFVLPVVMGITMFIQQKLNPAPMDPVQEKVMMTLPVVFTVFFAFFPSGLVLYWVVNNILSIAQQWLITRNLERAGLKS